MYSLDLPVILYSYYMLCILENDRHARSRGGVLYRILREAKGDLEISN